MKTLAPPLAAGRRSTRSRTVGSAGAVEAEIGGSQSAGSYALSSWHLCGQHLLVLPAQFDYRGVTISAPLREGNAAVARQTIQMLIDDIDGGEAEETVRFALDGVQYEIDLSEQNAGKMREMLARYIEAGSKVGRVATTTSVRSGPPRRSGKATVDRDQNRAIREWAQAKGIPVSDRGRIKQNIIDRFNAEAGR
jgi:hypothetical protein